MPRSSFVKDLSELPWPVGVVVAGLVFVGLKIFQASEPENQIMAALQPAISIPVYVFIALCLLGSLVSLVKKIRRQNQYQSTRSIADIRSLSWRDFESFVGEYFRSRGYSVIETPDGPDNGVDLVLRQNGEKTYVQCKHWKTNQVDVEKIRALLGSMAAGGAHAGIFVTSGSYTKPARKLASECGIQLIDGEDLVAMRERETESICMTLQLQQAFEEPSCPLCNSPMVERVAKKGNNKGAVFWGCPKFPKCTGTRDITQSLD